MSAVTPAGSTPAGSNGRKPRVAVLFGGRSSEHAVSCVTAAGVLQFIDRDKYDVVPVGIAKNGQWSLVADDPAQWSLSSDTLPEVTASVESLTVGQSLDDRQLVAVAPEQMPRQLGEIDVVLPLLHGPFGEDGTIQGLFELVDLRYVGAGVLASAVSMDKHFMKVIFESVGLNVGPYVVITDKQWNRDAEEAMSRTAGLGFPVFVKPARAGSSVGISKVGSRDGLLAAIESAREHDPKVLVEAAVEGREIECAVLGGRNSFDARASMPGEIVVDHAGAHEFYDFEAKYVDDTAAALTCPADLPDEVTERIQTQAVQAFDAVEAEGLSRVDFFYTPDGEVVVNEINTMPGFTPTSMYPQMWAKSGIGYTDLIDELIYLALNRKTGLR
ncbi:D-alanine--D-alanine ligase family protein [Arthrobacter sp. H14]|uniref:D-alanine--D-alanine ligase family protein n=1 Tax=Arthrobacter sp. H14 TaxID=1312959 RepID=UPI00047B941C|nr:D-alanine--D-alanine ligase family protein [Arthrobacter sp. H14]